MTLIHSQPASDDESFRSLTRTFQLHLHDRTLVLRRPLLVGVLNLTPDSFSDGGTFGAPEEAIAAAQRLILEGADILDIGAESSHPGALSIPLDEEIRRLQDVVPAVLALGAPVSIDTCKPAVADRALNWGAHLINDISGLETPMLQVAREHHCPVIVMHMAGTPRNMQQSPAYGNVVEEVYGFLQQRIATAKSVGVDTIADLGFGFGKSLEHNLELLRALSRFHDLGVPLLLGTSRKSSLGVLTGSDPQHRLEGTLATASWALERGVQLFRVHDVAAHRQTLQVTSALSHHLPTANTKVLLEKIPAEVNLGVPDSERAARQTVFVDLEFETTYRGDDDDIRDTVDYSGLPQNIKSLCSRRPFKLLETLAHEIAHALLEELPATNLTVRIHKPAAASNIGCDDVILERRFERTSLRPRRTAFIALGSNLGDRVAFLQAAVAELRRLGIVDAVSPWIETEPEGGVTQPRYLNGTARLRTLLSPTELLEELLEIERRFGRRRVSQSGQAESRTLDLDLLLYEDLQVDCEALTLPHPRLHLRKFVLEPLAEIAPDVVHPKFQSTATELLANLLSSSNGPS